MNILIYANCQVNQLVTGLKLALLGKANVMGIDINNPNAKDQLKKIASDLSSYKVDILLTNHGTEELTPYFSKDVIVEIPSIHFGGFHPDVVYFSASAAPTTPSFFMKNPTVSALALWGHLNKLTLDKMLSFYNEEVFEQLGYMDYFDVANHAIIKSYESHNVNTSYIEKHLTSRDVFMYGPLHPKFEVTLSLCFGICETLALQPSLSFNDINQMLPDPLQSEYAWGCFPPIANQLGVPGSWMIRHYNELFPTIKHYLTGFYQFLDKFESGSIQMFGRDKEKFETFHKIDTVLKRHI